MTVTDIVGSQSPRAGGVSDPQSLWRTTGCRAISLAPPVGPVERVDLQREARLEPVGLRGHDVRSAELLVVALPGVSRAGAAQDVAEAVGAVDAPAAGLDA